MRKYFNKISLNKAQQPSSKTLIYDYYTEEEQLKRASKACGKLAYACGEFKGTKTLKSLEYLAKRISEAEFLIDQIKATYNLEARVSEEKYYIEEDLKKQIDNMAQLEAVLEGV